MSPLIALPAFDQSRVDLQPVVITPVTQLVHALTSDSAPWLYSVLWQIQAHEEIGSYVPGVGQLRVGRQTADAARSAILTVRQRSLPTPTVCAVSGGGLGISWSVGPRRIEFTAYPDGEVTYAALVSGQLFWSGEVVATDDGGATLGEQAADLPARFHWLMGT